MSSNTAWGKASRTKAPNFAKQLAAQLSPQELQVFVQEAERMLKGANYSDKFREKALYPIRERSLAQVPRSVETGTQAAQSLLELSELQYHMGESKTYKSAEFAKQLVAQLSPQELQVFVQEAERKLKGADYSDKFREKALYPIRARLLALVPSTAETGVQAAQSLLDFTELQYGMGEGKSRKSAKFAKNLAKPLSQDELKIFADEAAQKLASAGYEDSFVDAVLKKVRKRLKG